MRQKSACIPESGLGGSRGTELNTVNWYIFWRIAALPTLCSAGVSYNLGSGEHAQKREQTKTSVGFERKTII